MESIDIQYTAILVVIMFAILCISIFVLINIRTRLETCEEKIKKLEKEEINDHTYKREETVVFVIYKVEVERDSEIEGVRYTRAAIVDSLTEAEVFLEKHRGDGNSYTVMME